MDAKRPFICRREMGCVLFGRRETLRFTSREFSGDADLLETILFVVDTKFLLHRSRHFDEPMADSNHGD